MNTVSEELAVKILSYADIILSNCGLTVNSLGRIEFLRQDFHNKKYIWPLGYSAVRTETLPSGKRLACHCQIMASPESLTPIFRWEHPPNLVYSAGSFKCQAL